MYLVLNDENHKKNGIIQNNINKEIKSKNSFYQNIGYVLLTVGLISLGFSIVHESSILAFIGIAFNLWGIMFLYVKSTKYVREDIVKSSIIDLKTNLEEIIHLLDYKGTPTYFTLNTLEGVSNVLVQISKNSNPNYIHTTQSNKIAIQETPPALIIKPPGHELSKLIEKELNTNFLVTDFNYISNNLEKVIVEELELAKYFKIEKESSTIKTYIKNGFFEDYTNMHIIDKSKLILGDPLTSAIACILSFITYHPIIIKSIEKVGDETITTYEIIQE